MRLIQNFFLVFIFCALSTAVTAAGWITLTNSNTKETKVIVKEQNDEMKITFQVNGYKLNKVITPKGVEYVPVIYDGSKIQKHGAPDLSSFSKSILLPDENDYDFEILSTDYIEINNVNIAPSKGIINRSQNPDEVPFVYGAEYNTDEFFPGKLVSTGTPYIMRDFRGQAVTVYPLQYNPVTKTLRIYKEMEVHFWRKETSGINTIVRSSSLTKVNEDFNNVYKNHFINFSSNIQKYTPVIETGNMLIICNDAYAAAMEPFVLWKKQKGIHTELVNVSTIGNNATSIKNYVTNYYNQNGLAYLLLVGDDAQVTASSTSAGDSDQDYSYILGSDHYSDILVGRFSAESLTDVQVQVEKVITYERDLDQADTWLNVATGIASDEGGSGQGDLGESDIIHMDFIRDTLLNYGYASVDQIYDPGASASTLAASINAGRGIIDYVGHGSDNSFVTTGFSNSDVNQLTNIDKWPYIFSVACVNGNFTGQTCFAEAWLRANVGGKPTGAVATLMSTINQSWNSPMCGEDEMVRLVTHTQGSHNKQTFGGIAVCGIAKMIDNYDTDGENMADTWTCFGDPSLLIRTKTPQAMQVTHPSVAFIGTTQFSVNCDVDSAIICLTLNGEILSTAYAFGGVANLTFNALTMPDTIKITATAQDYITYIGSALIVPNNGAYVVCMSQVVNDVTGNNNHLAEYNETVQLDVSLKNVGIIASQNVNIEVTSADTNITILQNQYSCGDINADETLLFSNAFSFSVNDFIPNNHNVLFLLTITDSNDSAWTSSFSVPVYSPVLNINYVGVSDPAGNNNHYLDPGESADINMKFLNNSISNGQNAYCLLSTTNAYITVVTDSLNIGGLIGNSFINGSFSISVDPAALPASYADFTFQLFSGSYSKTYVMSLPIGIAMEDWESAGFTTFAWTSAGDLPWVIDSVEKYEGAYSAKSGNIPNSQTWQDKTTELLLTVNVLINDSISFYKKVSSEQGYDFLRFFIDDVQQSEWSGEVEWSRDVYPVTVGQHVFKWVYSKDYMETGGSDCAWVDAIILPPADMGTKIESRQNLNNGFVVYPNPVNSSGILNVSIGDEISDNIYELTVCDITGKIISHYSFKENTLKYSLPDLEKGIYFINMYKNNTWYGTKKISVLD